VAGDRPQLLGGGLSNLYTRNVKGGAVPQFLIPQADANARFGVPSPITDPFVAVARNAFRAPAVRFYDASFVKRFRVTERVALRFEANAFNHAPTLFFGLQTRSKLFAGDFEKNQL